MQFCRTRSRSFHLAVSQSRCVALAFPDVAIPNNSDCCHLCIWTVCRPFRDALGHSCFSTIFRRCQVAKWGILLPLGAVVSTIVPALYLESVIQKRVTCMLQSRCFQTDVNGQNSSLAIHIDTSQPTRIAAFTLEPTLLKHSCHDSSKCPIPFFTFF